MEHKNNKKDVKDLLIYASTWIYLYDLLLSEMGRLKNGMYIRILFI